MSTWSAWRIRESNRTAIMSVRQLEDVIATTNEFQLEQLAPDRRQCLFSLPDLRFVLTHRVGRIIGAGNERLSSFPCG